jgi:putative phosphoesterase
MTKIGIISDIHSNFEALKVVIKYIKKHHIKTILCAGDMIGYYMHPSEVIKIIKDNKILCIKGNHEIGLLYKNLFNDFNIYARQGLAYSNRVLTWKDKEFLRRLPITYEHNFSGKKIIMVHGSPLNPLGEYVYAEDINWTFLKVHFKHPPDVLILGNTHLPFVKSVGDTVVINPGSVGQPRDGNPKTSFAIYDTNKHSAEIVRLEYNVEKVAKETRNELSAVLADRLYRGI